MWYGLVTSITSATTAVVWILLNPEFFYVSAIKAFFLSNLYSFFPVSMTWVMMMFFPDNAFVQTVYYMMVVMSISGPFYEHWASVITFVTDAEDYGKDGSGWNELGFILALVGMGAFTIFEMIM